jgi:hypothetical protein
VPRTDFVFRGCHGLLAPLLSFGRRCLTASLGVSLVLPRFGTPRASRCITSSIVQSGTREDDADDAVDVGAAAAAAVRGSATEQHDVHPRRSRRSTSGARGM